MQLLDFLMFGLLPIGALFIWDGINRLWSKSSYEKWQKRLIYRGENESKWKENLYNPTWYNTERFARGVGNIFLGLIFIVWLLDYYGLINLF